MAQNIKLAALTDDLIHAVLRFDPDENKRAFRHARDIAKHGLRAHHYARTNQFQVHASFRGLDEKFRVLNRDDLADALRARVAELDHLDQRPAKWIPDCLSLLLHLSDQPTENGRVEALELLRPPTPPPELTWKDIFNDPGSDEELWKDIDYAADSSEDDLVPVKKHVRPSSPPTSTDEDEDDTYHPEACVEPVDAALLVDVQDAQFWNRPADPEHGAVAITELQAVRETLFMLAGLPSSLYQADGRLGVEAVQIRHMLPKTAHHLLTALGRIGRTVHGLRRWVKRSSSLPLVQTFEAAVSTRLLDYDRALATLHKRYLVPDQPAPVSLLALHDHVRSLSRNILRLAQLVSEMEPQLLVNPFIHLEILFDQINLAQLTLEHHVFDFLSHIFFECLQTYLKPMRSWMEDGELGLNDETFFVFENDSGSDVSSLWHDRYVLRRGQGNKLRSPGFLEPAAHKIFNTGKSVVFLKELGIDSRLPVTVEEPRIDHETVCGNAADLPLSPFSELFQTAFQTWIESKYSLASNVLREYLFNDCGLMHTLDSFRTIYLSSTGSVFQDFADAIFERMDTSRRAWNDRFLLTELARGIFSSALLTSQSERIVVHSARKSAKSPSASVKALSHLLLDYALPWPIMNVIQRSSIPIYQQLSTFLLQTYRAKYLLQRVSLQSIQQIRSPRTRQLSYKLRQRLIWLADVLRSYLTATVIDPASAEMKSAMSKAEDMDEMSAIHIKYVARLQDQALLSENLKPIHRALLGLLDLGSSYAQQHVLREAALSKSAREGGAVGSKPGRKSMKPSEVAAEDSDSGDDGGDEESVPVPLAAADTKGEGLEGIDRELERLLRFVTAGLRSVGRVGAEPAWEMLADRLEWEGRRDG